MTIKELSEQLETQINQRLEVLGRISKEIMDLDAKILDLGNTIDQKEKQMQEIILDLKPVEYVVRKTNPAVCDFIDNYIKSKNIVDFRKD